MAPLPPHPTILITGATDGIGKTTAQLLAQQGARIVVHGRNPAKVQQTCANLPQHGGKEPHLEVVADLLTLQASKTLAQTIIERAPQLNVLLLNAGTFFHERKLTSDGFEQTMAINHFTPLLLIHHLLEAHPLQSLQRIVLVSSIAHTKGTISLDNITLSQGPFDGYQAYAASKLANVLTAMALAPRLQQRGIQINALHPGVVNTTLLRTGFPNAQGQDSLTEGAQTSVYLAMAPEAANATGQYFVRCQPAPSHPICQNASFVHRFYELSCQHIHCAPIALPS